MSSSSESDFASATEMFKEVFEEVAKEKQLIEEEKQKWEEEKAKIRKTFSFDEQRIILDVGGTRYSTSCSTLTKYPESVLGVMFSGRHDLDAMKCSDGSFFIDRDGTYFRHILNYLRDGKKAIHFFPNSSETLHEIFHEATFYQLEGLVTALREFNTVCQNDILLKFRKIHSQSSTYCYQDYDASEPVNNRQFGVIYQSYEDISYKVKSMKKVSFSNIDFVHSVTFISCDLSNASFHRCRFQSTVTFEECILDGTTFSFICGLVDNSSFTGSNTDNAKFDSNLRVALQSAGKIK